MISRKEQTKHERETLIDSPKTNGLLTAEIPKANNLSKVFIPKTNGPPRILLEQSLFSQKNFDEFYQPGDRPSNTLKDTLKKNISKCWCSGTCLKNFLYTVFPFIHILKSYNIRTNLSGDIVSGLTVGIMHIPQGMAYGMLTTLPPVYGLYMSFFPVILYFFFGSSKHISIGTFAVVCLMIGSTVTKGLSSVTSTLNVAGNLELPGNQSNLTDAVSEDASAMSAEELDIRLQFAMSVSFVAGIVQLLMGFFRLGFITTYLSDPLISGFTTGAACHVFTSQIKHVFGVKTKRYSGAFKLIRTYKDFFINIPTTNAITLIISILCMAILYSVGRFINRNPKLKAKMFMPVPIELIVVVLGTVISYFINLEEKYNVVVVDDIPTGLPMPSMHPFSRTTDVISDAITMAIVIFAVSISMAKILAKKHDYEVDANQELIAFGISTIVSSFFSSSAPSASLSRSLIQENVGGKTQIAGLISCGLLLVVLLAIGPYFRTLPNCVLAAIIIVALRGMFLQILDLKKLWSVSVIDFCVWIVAFLATVVLDVDLGLIVAVGFGIFTIVCRSQRPYSCLLGQIPGMDLYRDISVYHEAKEVDGIKIFRFDSSLFFINTECFRTNLYKKTVNPRDLKIIQKKRESKLKKQEKKMKEEKLPEDYTEMEIRLQKDDDIKITVVGGNLLTGPQDIDFHTIIIDCTSWSFIDTMGIKVLSAVVRDYKSVSVQICLVNCKSGLREMFQKTKFYDTLDQSNIYLTVHDAIVQLHHEESPALSIQNNVSCESEVTPTGASNEDADNKFEDLKYVDDEDKTNVESSKLVSGSSHL